MEATPGRSSQVIKVVMPTYIMAPTEDERYEDLTCPRQRSSLIAFMVTSLRCRSFRRKKVCNIIAECMAKELDGKEFDETDCKTWSTSIADTVKTRIHADCNFPRYKIVVQTFIGQQRLQDVHITSRCLWDNDHDNHASAVFNSVCPARLAGWFLCFVASSSIDGIVWIPFGSRVATHLGNVRGLRLLFRLNCNNQRQQKQPSHDNEPPKWPQHETAEYNVTSINYFLGFFFVVCT
ncbi:hypothetical protein BBJ28_00017624 [Nothophytophthora sp. Chile5]|nr:hypothetical protein BBJ28_00017624 [Nothophytophthora sp. Chile5]